MRCRMNTICCNYKFDNLKKLKPYIAHQRLMEVKELKLDVIYYKIQGKSILRLEIKLVNCW